MASRILHRRCGRFLWRPSARVAEVVRHFSSHDEQPSHSNVITFEIRTSEFQWPETQLGPFEPQDRRFPLPGIVGSLVHPTASPSSKQKKSIPIHRPRYDADILVAELPYERQSTTFEQFVAVNAELMVKSSSSQNNSSKELGPFDHLQCFAYDCPFLLRKDFCELFPNCSLQRHDNLTVITICRRASVGSQDTVANDAILVDFVCVATDICETLHTAGFWADFLDPASGRPYIGCETELIASFEVDERYRRFGFEIDDGSSGARCRVLRHHELGSRPFVGCVFTTAPTTHALIAQLSVSAPQSTGDT